MTSKTPTAPAVQYIKRRAKTIKKQIGIAHHEALDRSAQEAGFHNFKHALNSIASEGPTTSLLVTVHSGDRSLDAGTLTQFPNL